MDLLADCKINDENEVEEFLHPNRGNKISKKNKKKNKNQQDWEDESTGNIIIIISFNA